MQRRIRRGPSPTIPLPGITIAPARTAICRFRCGSWCGRARPHRSISRLKYSRGIRTTRRKPSSSSTAASPPTIIRPSMLFRMATLPQYRLNWPTGETEMMLISIGTGSAAAVSRDLNVRGQLVAGQRRAPSRRADGRRRDRPGYQLPRCRPLRVRRADRPGARRHDSAAAAIRSRGPLVPLEEDCGRQFLYARYNPDVSRGGLDALGLNAIDPDHVQALDQIEYIDEMQSVGRKYAETFVDMKPFQRFVKQADGASAASAS